MTHPATPPEPMRVRLLQARLFDLIMLIDDSGALAYRRQLHLTDLARRLVFLIGVYRRLTSLEIANYTGSEKALISRGIKTLTEHGLIERPSLRSRMTLSEAGEKTFRAIIKVAGERNELLCIGIESPQIARFVALTRRLIDRAAALYAQEGADSGIGTFHPPTLADAEGKTIPENTQFNRMVMPGLQSLTTYLRRGSTQIYKREAGLSSFEWQILSQIGEYQPTNLTALVEIVRRNKSQVGRTVKALEETGLVARLDRGRTNASLALTDKGNRVYARMCEIAIERNDILVCGFDAEERSFYLDIVDRLRANARRMLSAERGDPKERNGERRPKTVATEEAELLALREENARLKRLLAEAVLEISVLKDGHGAAARPSEKTISTE